MKIIPCSLLFMLLSFQSFGSQGKREIMPFKGISPPIIQKTEKEEKLDLKKDQTSLAKESSSQKAEIAAEIAKEETQKKEEQSSQDLDQVAAQEKTAKTPQETSQEQTGEVIIVEMKNRGSDGESMVFEPDFVKANIGDTIHFVATTKGHSVDAIRGNSIPEGASEIKGKLNRDYLYKVKKEGVYIYRCKPHYAMGMIGVISVGEPHNLDEIKSLRLRGKKTKERFEKILTNF